MHSDILACERSTYPVLLHCLQYLSHDVRRLQLVNKGMCAAYRHFKDQVDEHTAKRQHLSRQADALDMTARLTIAMCNLRMARPKDISYPISMNEMWADLERVVMRSHAIEPRLEPRMVFSVHRIYANNIFDDSFVRGSRTFNRLLEETAVIEVD